MYKRRKKSAGRFLQSNRVVGETMKLAGHCSKSQPENSADNYDLYANFDGGCQQNPGGEATWAFVIKDKNGHVLLSSKGNIEAGGTSNNVAECVAAAFAIGAIMDLAGKGWRVLLRGDSQIAINKLGSKKRGKGLFQEACDVMQFYYNQATNAGIQIDAKWVPREENEEADALTEEAYTYAATRTEDAKPDWLAAQEEHLRAI